MINVVFTFLTDKWHNGRPLLRAPMRVLLQVAKDPVGIFAGLSIVVYQFQVVAPSDSIYLDSAVTIGAEDGATGPFVTIKREISVTHRAAVLFHGKLSSGRR